MARIAYNPREYQPIITNHILDNARCGIWAGMGLGKTCATLTAIDALILAGEISLDDPVLVLAPLRVARSTWPDEVAKWQHLKDIKITSLIGSISQRRNALRQRAHIFTLNYENIPWLIEELAKQNRPWPFKMIISDEATKLKGFRSRQGTQRAKALARVAHAHCKRFVELTGTPSPNGLQDLWGQIWFLDGGQRLGRTFSAFSERWFQTSFDGYGMDPLPFAREQIEGALRDICVSLNAADYFDLKEPIINIIPVDLPDNARAIYDDMEARMFAEIEGHEVEAFNAATRTMKCLQLANGAAYIDEKAETWKEVHDEKIKALEEIIEEAAGAPVLVAYHFRSDLDRLRRAFPKGRILDKKPETLRDWNKGKIPLLFAHPASAGHGLNLQDGGNILVFFSVNWNLEEHEQIVERIGPVRQLQAGHDRPVFIHYILARNTVDYLVRERLASKREVQDILMEAMKHRKVRKQ